MEDHNVILHYGPKSKPCYIRIDLDDGSVTIGDCKIGDNDWLALKRRIDKVLTRKGFGEPRLQAVETPRGTKFILKNLKTLNDVQCGLPSGLLHPHQILQRRW